MNIPRKARLCGALAVVLSVAIGLGALTTKRAHADTADLAAKVLAVVAIAAAGGYSCRDSFDPVYLSRGRGFYVDTTLYRGTRYKILGVGDDGIRRIDLTVVDGLGNVIGDAETQLPRLDVNVWRSGAFQYQLMVTSGAGMAAAIVCYEDN